jgi:hypothetical protein
MPIDHLHFDRESERCEETETALREASFIDSHASNAEIDGTTARGIDPAYRIPDLLQSHCRQQDPSVLAKCARFEHAYLHFLETGAEYPCGIRSS